MLSVLLDAAQPERERQTWSAVCDQERSASAPTSCFEHVRGYPWRTDPLSLRSRSESDIRLHVCSGEDCANAEISRRAVTRRVPTPRSMRHLCRVRAYTCANIRPASDADAAQRGAVTSVRSSVGDALSLQLQAPRRAQHWFGRNGDGNLGALDGNRHGAAPHCENRRVFGGYHSGSLENKIPHKTPI